MSIAVAGLSVSLGGVEIVRDVSFTVGDGGWLGLIGPNGAGKSTILRAVVGTVPSTGAIVLDGRPADADVRRRARTVAYVPQRPELPAGMRVLDYVLLGRTPHLGLFGSEGRRDLRVAESALERLELGGFADRALATLSGGEAQRAVLARAIAQEPRVLVMDEPTTGLDLGHQEQVLELADELRRERALTVVCSLHDLTLAAQFCPELVLVDRGRICARGAPSDVLDAERIAAHFGADVTVVDHPAGGLVVVARRKGARAQTAIRPASGSRR